MERVVHFVAYVPTAVDVYTSFFDPIKGSFLETTGDVFGVLVAGMHALVRGTETLHGWGGG